MAQTVLVRALQETVVAVVLAAITVVVSDKALVDKINHRMCVCDACTSESMT